MPDDKLFIIREQGEFFEPIELDDAEKIAVQKSIKDDEQKNEENVKNG